MNAFYCRNPLDLSPPQFSTRNVQEKQISSSNLVIQPETTIAPKALQKLMFCVKNSFLNFWFIFRKNILETSWICFGKMYVFCPATNTELLLLFESVFIWFDDSFPTLFPTVLGSESFRAMNFRGRTEVQLIWPIGLQFLNWTHNLRQTN